MPPRLLPLAVCTGTGLQPSPGRTEPSAFLFCMNQLFEEFIAEFIRRELREVWQSRGWTHQTARIPGRRSITGPFGSRVCRRIFPRIP